MSKLISNIRYWFHCRLNVPPVPRDKWEVFLSSPWESFFNYGFFPYCMLFQVSLWENLWQAIFSPVIDRSQQR